MNGTQQTSTTSGARRWARALTSAGAVSALAVLGACSTGDEPAAPGGTTAGVTVLEAPAADGPAAACAPVDAASLSGSDLAVEAVALEERGDVVVLDVTEDFAGGAHEQVEVPQGDDEVPGELSAGRFEVGQTYLLSADDGVLLVCGLTGPASPELRAVYTEAFPG